EQGAAGGALDAERMLIVAADTAVGAEVGNSDVEGEEIERVDALACAAGRAFGGAGRLLVGQLAALVDSLGVAIGTLSAADEGEEAAFQDGFQAEELGIHVGLEVVGGDVGLAEAAAVAADDVVPEEPDVQARLTWKSRMSVAVKSAVGEVVVMPPAPVGESVTGMAGRVAPESTV